VKYAEMQKVLSLSLWIYFEEAKQW
jgi:hypothetical protein